MLYKKCYMCGEEKAHDKFGKDSKQADGLRIYCKTCIRTRAADRRARPEVRKNNQDFSRQYNREHKKERRAYRLEYESRPEVREKITKRDQNWWRKSPEKKLLYGAKQRAKKFDIPFNLDVSDILIPENCPVLGIPLVKGVGKVTDSSPSLDRIVPSWGYVKGNVCVISFRANTIKSNATVDELERVADYIKNLPREMVLIPLPETKS